MHGAFRSCHQNSWASIWHTPNPVQIEIAVSIKAASLRIGIPRKASRCAISARRHYSNTPPLNRSLPSRVEIGEMSAASDKSSPQMAQGQVWRIDDAYLYIVEIGRRMIYYKMARQAGERTLATQMIGIDALAAYLKATEATLMS